MKNLKWVGLASVLIAIFFSSCASVPMSSPKDDADAKHFSVPSQTSRIYVYRNEAFGAAVKIPLSLDGQTMGQTAKNVFYSWDVPAGDHEIACLAESNSHINVKTTSGKATYVWQEMKMGMWAAGCLLHEVDEATGQKGIADCKLADSAPIAAAPKPAVASSNADKLRELKKLKDDGTISDADYQQQKKKILDQGL